MTTKSRRNKRKNKRREMRRNRSSTSTCSNNYMSVTSLIGNYNYNFVTSLIGAGITDYSSGSRSWPDCYYLGI